MVYYVFVDNIHTANLAYKFDNENDFIEYYLEKRLQCEKDYVYKNIKYDIMKLPLKIFFFKKKMATVYIDNETTLTYYVMKLPNFCNKFFEKIFCSFIKL